MVSLQPAQPTAKTAEIVLLLNGVELARRPWRGYVQNMAALANAQRRPDAFFGIVPFFPTQDATDAGLRQLYWPASGRPRVRSKCASSATTAA